MVRRNSVKSVIKVSSEVKREKIGAEIGARQSGDPAKLIANSEK